MRMRVAIAHIEVISERTRASPDFISAGLSVWNMGCVSSDVLVDNGNERFLRNRFVANAKGCAYCAFGAPPEQFVANGTQMAELGRRSG
jgi:hypothetical protein